MSIVKRNKLYSLYSVTHRATGCYHLVVTYLGPDHFSTQPLISYMNDFKNRTHKINNHALREFSVALAPFKVEDFDLRTVVSNVEHSEAKAKALIESLRLGADKLLTAHLVKPVLWELNLSAKLRMQNGEPSPYKKEHSPQWHDPESTGPLTKFQSIALNMHPCKGMTLYDAEEELKFHANIIKVSNPTDRACQRSMRMHAEVQQYAHLLRRFQEYGVSDTIDLNVKFKEPACG